LDASYENAGLLGFDDLIDPRMTRNVLIDTLRSAVYRRQVAPTPKARVGVMM
jgi:hypothetical protein